MRISGVIIEHRQVCEYLWVRTPNLLHPSTYERYSIWGNGTKICPKLRKTHSLVEEHLTITAIYHCMKTYFFSKLLKSEPILLHNMLRYDITCRSWRRNYNAPRTWADWSTLFRCCHYWIWCRRSTPWCTTNIDRILRWTPSRWDWWTSQRVTWLLISLLKKNLFNEVNFFNKVFLMKKKL